MRRFARSVLGGVFFLGFGLGGLVLGLAFFPPLAACGARRAMRALVRGAYRLFVGAGRATGLFRVDLPPADRARLASLRGAVVVANHLTLIDVVILLACLPDATAIAKAAAGRNLFYAAIVRAVFLVNDDPARVLAAARGLLAAGVNLVVFPEGTRGGAPRRPLRRGAAQIALRAGAPLVPVRLACTPPVLGKGQPWHDLGAHTIVWTLRVGAPIAVPRAQTGHHAAARALTDRIGAALFGAEREAV